MGMSSTPTVRCNHFALVCMQATVGLSRRYLALTMLYLLFIPNWGDVCCFLLSLYEVLAGDHLGSYHSAGSSTYFGERLIGGDLQAGVQYLSLSQA